MSKVFPKWSNALPLQIIIFLFIFSGAVTAGVTYYFTPKYTQVGYTPKQPVPFNHSLHASQLGIDCRYCHTYVEKSPHSNIPTSETCMNCHSQVKTDSPLLEPVRESFRSGQPVPWVRIHKLPDYVYFDHSVHVNRGISCYSCHGQINQMNVVSKDQPQSMSWCLDCHRHPEKNIRPLNEVYNLNWHAASEHDQLVQGAELVKAWNVKPPLTCNGCHR